MVDRRYVDPRDLGDFGNLFRASDDGTFRNIDGEEIDLDMFGLEAVVWDLPTLRPEDIHRGLRALVITDDGGDRGDNDYFERITFLDCVELDLTHVPTSRGILSLSELGICGNPGCWCRHDVFTLEETEENIRILDEELERTNYDHARIRLRRFYRRWLR